MFSQLGVLCARLLCQASETSTTQCTRAITTSRVVERFMGGPAVVPSELVREDETSQPSLVDSVLSGDLMSRKESNKVVLQETLERFQRFPGDTGSSEVQVGLLSQKIQHMSLHSRQHRKDHSSRRGLLRALNQRRKLLQYLRRTDFDSYVSLITKLGLKDNYYPMDRLSARYRTQQ